MKRREKEEELGKTDERALDAFPSSSLDAHSSEILSVSSSIRLPPLGMLNFLLSFSPFSLFFSDEQHTHSIMKFNSLRSSST